VAVAMLPVVVALAAQKPQDDLNAPASPKPVLACETCRVHLRRKAAMSTQELRMWHQVRGASACFSACCGPAVELPSAR